MLEDQYMSKSLGRKRRTNVLVEEYEGAQFAIRKLLSPIESG